MIDIVYMKDAPIRLRNKLQKVARSILEMNKELDNVDICVKSVANRNGNMNSSLVTFKVESSYECLDHMEFQYLCKRGISDTPGNILLRGFDNEYAKYKMHYLNILTKD